MKSKDTQLLEEAYKNVSINLRLQEMWRNDVRNVSPINEGIGDTIKTKLVQPLVDFLFKKIRETAPDTFDGLSKAIQSGDESSIAAIFNDPAVKQEQNKISQQVTTESLTYISEEDKSPSLLKSVWSWVKNNPKLSAVAALAALAVIGLAVYGSGGVVPLLLAVGSKSLSGATAGGIGGTVIAGAKSAIKQGKEGGVSFKQTAKDALKGGAVGAAAGAVGGALGAVGQAAAAGAGMVSKEISSYIEKLIQSKQPADKMLAQITQANANDPYWKFITKSRAEGILDEGDINIHRKDMAKILDGTATEAEIKKTKEVLMDAIKMQKDTNSLSDMNKSIGQKLSRLETQASDVIDQSTNMLDK